MRTDIIEQKEQILKWIEENQSKSFIARELRCKQETLNKYLKIMEISYVGNQSGKGIKIMPQRNDYMPLDIYLKESKDIQTNKIRIKIIKEGIKPHKCECCGNTEWLGNPIPLEVHHKDGDRTHNELDNFELLCPNCHAFTDSYRGKNSKK